MIDINFANVDVAYPFIFKPTLIGRLAACVSPFSITQCGFNGPGINCLRISSQNISNYMVDEF